MKEPLKITSYIYALQDLSDKPGLGVDTLNEASRLAAMGSVVEPNAHDRPGALNRLSGSFISVLSKTRGVTAMDVVKVLEGMYGVGKPLASVDIDAYSVTALNLPYAAAIYFIQQNDGFTVGERIRPEVKRSVAKVAFEQGKKWDELKQHLEMIDAARPGYKLTEGIPDLLVNLDKYCLNEHDMGALQASGGVERIKEVGANLQKLNDNLFSKWYLKLSQNNLALVCQFAQDSMSELLAQKAITQESLCDRYAKLIVGTVRAWNRQNPPKPHSHRTSLDSLLPHITPQAGSEIIPMLTRWMPVAEIKAMFKDPRAVIETELFKAMLQKHGDVEHSYDLVMTLGLDDLFSRYELNQLKGKKLESVLGL